MSMDVVNTITSAIKQCRDLLDIAASYDDKTDDLKDIGEAISDRVRFAEGALHAVQEKECLRTPAVNASIEDVSGAIQQLTDYHEKIIDDSDKKAVKIWNRIAPNGKLQRNYKTKLGRLLDTLNSSVISLQIHISMVHVGIVGSYQDGFFVPHKLLESVNQTVYINTGHNLIVKQVLEGRAPGSDGMLKITESDQKAIEEATKMKLNETARSGSNEAVFVSGNIGDQGWRVVTGDIGVESDPKKEMYKVTVTNNHVREGGCVITGHMSAEAAAQLYPHIFK